MSHIAVERNRRRQMNDHLKVLRSLTPALYIKRGDQASIIGGAVDFIRELQQLLDSLEAKKRRRSTASFSSSPTPSPRSLLAAGSALSGGSSSSDVSPNAASMVVVKPSSKVAELAACCNSPVADVEARISGSNVLLRTLSRRVPGQALRMIAVLETLHLEVIHLNISTMEDTVLYSFVLKIGLECQLSVEELAYEVQQTFLQPELELDQQHHQQQQDNHLMYSAMAI
ncbi:hypothetical protein ACP70R_035968 [Stipagrostis hirtigluma subsp. patula]